MAKATLLYDGDCGVCDDGMQRIRTRMKPPVTIASYQSMDIDAMGVRLDTVVNQGPVLVQEDADVLVGPAAIAQVMQLSGRPYAPIGKVMNAPGFRQVLAWIGPKLYRQRYRMPGAGESCKVPTTESPKAA